jgi:hypothetical protein
MMNICPCGREAEPASTLCARCAALQTLELAPRATDEQIRNAYRTLVKVWHPDRFQADPRLKETADAKLKALNAAYILLTRIEISDEKPRRPQPAATRPRPAVRPARARARFSFQLPTAVLLKFGLLAGAVLVAGAFLFALDGFFASDPTTGRVYSTARAQVVANARETADTIWSQADHHLHTLLPAKSEAAPIAAPITANASLLEAAAQSGDSPQSLHRREPGASRAETVKLQPYITAGLTREEVIAVLGAPTSSTETKLIYGDSELDLTSGKLSGWNIAPAALIRVKLWPDAPVDPDLTAFHLGSTKNEVLVAQGTPTLYSEKTFGYGGSRVFFENNRVVSWKNDPSTVPLHIAQ